MNLQEYQEKARTTAIYLDNHENLVVYPMLGLIGESGELTEKIKKMIRDDAGSITDERRLSILAEIGDCCWYVSNLCSDLEIDLADDRYNAFASQSKNITYWSLPLLVMEICQNISSISMPIQSCCINQCDGQWESLTGCAEEVRIYIPLVLATLQQIALQFGSTLEEVCQNNITKLLDRKDRNVIHGDGDTR